MKEIDTFRYLMKYVGKYRVKAHLTLEDDFIYDVYDKLDDSYDELYIPCYGCEIRHTYEYDKNGVKFYIYSGREKGKKIVNALKEEYGDSLWLEVDDLSSWDFMVYFYEKDLEKIFTVVKPHCSGAKISPYSPKNLPRKVKNDIDEKQNARYKKLLERLDMNQMEIAHFIRSCVTDFNDVILKKKGKDYDILKERKALRLKPKEFIIYIGMYNEFLDLLEERVNQYESQR